MLAWGSRIDFISKIPDSPAWKNQPGLKVNLYCVMKALDDLASSRGENGIPFMAIIDYAKMVGLEPYWLADRLMTVDRRIMRHHADKLEKNRG